MVQSKKTAYSVRACIFVEMHWLLSKAKPHDGKLNLPSNQGYRQGLCNIHKINLGHIGVGLSAPAGLDGSSYGSVTNASSS